MKKIYVLFLPLFIGACTPPPEARYTDAPMPKSELEFIKKVTTIDSSYNAQTNDITKDEYLKKGKKELADYILNNLDVRDWVVKVDDIKVDSTSLMAFIKVDMFVPIGNWRENGIPNVSFPVFTALLKTSESKVKSQLKVLEKMDEVYVTGKIIPNLSGGINILSTNEVHDDNSAIYNIGLDLDLTDIKKTR